MPEDAILSARRSGQARSSAAYHAEAVAEVGSGQTSNSAIPEPGSYRDRSSRVYYRGADVYRALDETGAKDWEALQNTKFFARLTKSGKIIPSQSVPEAPYFKDSLFKPSIVLKHERIPFVSYPYEWSFGMLKDAALLQLEILNVALEENFILKDGSAFNISFVGSQPIFHDIGSFTSWQPGDIWAGYRQFCETMLFPLFLSAYRGVNHQTWCRGSLEGVAVTDAYRLFSLRDWFRPGIFKHVVLQHMLERQFASSTRNVRSEVKSLSFSNEIVKTNARSLKRLVTSLNPRLKTSTWANYADSNSYGVSDHSQKRDFIQNITAIRKRSLVWDIGANTGTFSRLVAENSAQVLALDFDALAVERMYQSLSVEKDRRILPLVMNAANPSPGHGWLGTERTRLESRGQPDLVLALALIHHLVISAHVPLPEFVNWLGELTPELVIEFVTRADPMVQTLLRNKADIYSDYDQTTLERCLKKHFRIERQEALLSGNRIIYYCSRL